MFETLKAHVVDRGKANIWADSFEENVMDWTVRQAPGGDDVEHHISSKGANHINFKLYWWIKPRKKLFCAFL